MRWIVAVFFSCSCAVAQNTLPCISEHCNYESVYTGCWQSVGYTSTATGSVYDGKVMNFEAELRIYYGTNGQGPQYREGEIGIIVWASGASNYGPVEAPSDEWFMRYVQYAASVDSDVAAALSWTTNWGFYYQHPVTPFGRRLGWLNEDADGDTVKNWQDPDAAIQCEVAGLCSTVQVQTCELPLGNSGDGLPLNEPNIGNPVVTGTADQWYGGSIFAMSGTTTAAQHLIDWRSQSKYSPPLPADPRPYDRPYIHAFGGQGGAEYVWFSAPWSQSVHNKAELQWHDAPDPEADRWVWKFWKSTTPRWMRYVWVANKGGMLQVYVSGVWRMLPQTFNWFVVSSTDPAVPVLRGNSPQFPTDPVGTVGFSPNSFVTGEAPTAAQLGDSTMQWEYVPFAYRMNGSWRSAATNAPYLVPPGNEVVDRGGGSGSGSGNGITRSDIESAFRSALASYAAGEGQRQYNAVGNALEDALLGAYQGDGTGGLAGAFDGYYSPGQPGGYVEQGTWNGQGTAEGIGQGLGGGTSGSGGMVDALTGDSGVASIASLGSRMESVCVTLSFPYFNDTTLDYEVCVPPSTETAMGQALDDIRVLVRVVFGVGFTFAFISAMLALIKGIV